MIKAILASVPVGTIAGLAFGYAERGGYQGTRVFLSAWFASYFGEAFFWALAGAIAIPLAVYAVCCVLKSK